MSDTICRRPSSEMRTISSASSTADMSDDRRLPPLPRVEPLPRGPFNPFTSGILAHFQATVAHTSSSSLEQIHHQVPSPPTSHDAFPVKSPWPPAEHMVAPPSPAISADGSWPDSLPSTKTREFHTQLTHIEIWALIFPKNINRKPPLQQLCGRKRKGSMITGDGDGQREKHRIAEGNRRKNLSHLHRDLDSRIHDFFLERAGWNPSKSLPESKEHIVQAAIFLIDFMGLIIVHLIRQENEMPHDLPDRLQAQMRCMHLQELVTSLQQQNQTSQQQIKALKQENRMLEERNQTLEFQLKTYEHMFRASKGENMPPQSMPSLQEVKPRNMLPGLRVFCDEIAVNSPDSRLEPIPTAPSQSFGHSYLSHTPPVTGPSSPMFAQTSYSVPASRRPSLPSP